MTRTRGGAGALLARGRVGGLPPSWLAAAWWYLPSIPPCLHGKRILCRLPRRIGHLQLAPPRLREAQRALAAVARGLGAHPAMPIEARRGAGQRRALEAEQLGKLADRQR